MRLTRIFSLGIAAIAFFTWLAVSLSNTQAKQVRNDSIRGLVTSSAGPEAGVWVIAETTDLLTRYIKEVVTDDHGRYLIPGLPKAKYTVWARGYGLVDSPKVETVPGRAVDLRPGVAPDNKGRCALLPRLIIGTPYSRCPRKTNSQPQASGSGISPNIKSQGAVDPSDQDR